MNASSNRYGLVKAIAFILKLLAWLALLAGVLAAVAAGVSGNAPGIAQVLSRVGLIVGPVVGIIWFVQLFAFGSILSLLVEIEENTRQLVATESSAK